MRTKKSINLFEPRYRVQECLARIEKVLESGWTAPGPETLQFEKEWRIYTELPHAHFLSSATAGLHLALEVLRRHRDGRTEVITTPLTFVSTNHAVLYAGLRPVFADVDEYLCMDPEALRVRINRRTMAVIFVGVGGNSGRLREISDICRQYDVPLVIDAAHMAGTRLSGRHVGAEGAVAIFSFQTVKNLPAGDGGMICFQKLELDREARQLAWMGIDRDTYARSSSSMTYKWRYEVNDVGFKYAGNAIAAAIARVGLKHLDEDNRHRRMLAAKYDKLLADRCEIVPTAEGCLSARHLYQVRVAHRDDVLLRLNEHKVFPGVHYINNNRYAMYTNSGHTPKAEKAAGDVLSLPLHCKMTQIDAECVAQALLESLCL